MFLFPPGTGTSRPVSVVSTVLIAPVRDSAVECLLQMFGGALAPPPPPIKNGSLG